MRVRGRTRARGVAALACAAVVAALATGTGPPAEASSVLVVAQQNASCSDAGPGTSTTPYCTISAAAKAAGSGDTVSVQAGTYRETVTTPSGVTFQTASATVAGTDSLDLAVWSATGGNAWTTKLSATAAPTQVLKGSTLLTKAASAATTTTDSWFFDSPSRTLYVDLGGPAPTAGDALKARRSYGFLVRNATGVTVQGFSLVQQGVAGVYLETSTNSTVTGVTVSGSASYGVFDSGGTSDDVTSVHVMNNGSVGIRMLNTTGSSVTSSTATANGYHGISAQGGSGVRIANNTASANLKAGTRVAAGIDVSLSSLNPVVERNVSHDNDDSGIEIYTGSTGAVVRRNVTYDNGDHGIDVSSSPNATVVSNTSVGNATSGLNVEGVSGNGSTGTSLRDNISVDNAVNTTRSKGAIRVDAASVPGTTIDRDLVYQSDGTTPLFEWNAVLYASLSTFRSASNQETHGKAANPQFVNLGARNLQLGPASPALDAAASSVTGWADKDQTGASPVDQPDVVDTGTGPVAFADLGALERTTVPVDNPPTAKLSATPGAVDTGQVVTLDASASTDDHGITQYAFVCDAGGPVTTKSSPTSTCTYQSGGAHHPAVTVSDSKNQTDVATQTVNVTVPPTAPMAALTAAPASVKQGVTVKLDAGASLPGQSSTITSYTFTCGRQPAKAAQASPTSTCRFTKVGSWTVSVLVANSSGLSDTATAVVKVTAGTPPTARLSLRPSVVRVGRLLHADASASTSTSVSHIVRYRFKCGSKPATAWITKSATTCKFKKPGRFAVTAWVRSDLGLVDKVVKYARVRR
jgi:parallel beta-helix repeat protein